MSSGWEQYYDEDRRRWPQSYPEAQHSYIEEARKIAKAGPHQTKHARFEIGAVVGHRQGKVVVVPWAKRHTLDEIFLKVYGDGTVSNM
jgi:hypothetical protein